ncbi:hypothetical protein A3E39_01430 [Candidatus Uhrbacteria bacterium RIFCSPHIGHO2_12_FULL_60_25]|uniref:Transcriptional regulator n=1 Tax=Candidatus Uhrbacteria bacterium RIFCSPHIGHO2_12_FULL_60_25 TaxID=1802399 RepID=A0A1F7UKN4_9BACT|nr:MAG: hypothetical protein A3D73_03450 [Candidatus Uhrbacteria bacterium RIFCSPHIGHO2_02_FULL_60_44]OGL78805.1 MAG: hypothetical protein A3E39_01430 [Candidatus Uhrbacteria bacterium RIFCSPHIGHO2_12_FULL_60_25]
MIPPYTEQTTRTLMKARGQLNSVIAMVKDDRYCMDLIQQNNAVIGLLRQANNLMLESHLHSCGSALGSKRATTRMRFIKEILRACNISQRKG